ncbi:g3636 [Coccomyxa elongata]
MNTWAGADFIAVKSDGLSSINCTEKESEKQAQEHLSRTAGKMAERVLREWVEQPQHLMARPLQPELALRAEHKVA